MRLKERPQAKTAKKPSNMKSTITGSLTYLSDPHYNLLIRIFGLVIDTISRAKTGLELRDDLEWFERSESIHLFFDYGFTASQFWVKQKGQQETIILVEL